MSLLSVEGLSKEFGGVHAVEDLSFAIRPGAVHAVIGPNGAGKTTLFNLISGLYAPSRGRIVLDGRDVAGRPAQVLAGLGVGRTFQTPQVFHGMTALENVMVGAHRHLRHGVWPALLGLSALARRDYACAAECTRLMESVGLDRYVHAPAATMPYGALKRLEIARALAGRPRLLLLDEPAAGLNPSESAELGRLVRQVAADGVTVLLVEHDMKMVMGVSDHVLVLNYGRKLAEGTPDQVRADPAVVEAYLGRAG